MRLVLLTIFLSIKIGLCAQSFTLDTTFQPFFDIRNQRGPRISVVSENQFDGRIYVLGNFKSYYNLRSFEGAVCYNKDGSLYPNFSLQSTGYVDTFFPISDSSYFIGNSGSGTIIDSVGNAYNNSNWRLNQIKSVSCGTGLPFFYKDGSSLFANGSNNTGLPCKIINPPDTFPGKHIIKLTPQGIWDSTFIHDSNYPPNGFVPYDSNRIFVYGYPWRFTHYDGVRVDGLCRIFLDGTLDTTFTSPLNPNLANQIFNPRVVDDDGSIFLVGTFYLKGLTTKNQLVKLESNGNLDNTFLNFQGPEDTIYDLGLIDPIAKTDDGGYLVGGIFNKYQGHVLPALAKIDSTGKVEPQYFATGGPDSSYTLGQGFPLIGTILKSKYGGYYIAGDFLKWDGQPCQPIVRIKDMVTGVKENFMESAKMSIYPNPTNGLVNIESEFHIQELKLYDLMGKELYRSNTNKRTKNLLIDINNYSKGIYFLSVQLRNGQVVSKKLVKN